MLRLNYLLLAAAGVWTLAIARPAASQPILIAHFKFDGSLDSETIDIASPPISTPPAGTLREGADAGTATTGTAVYGQGVDGMAGGALMLDGVDDWLDLTVSGRPNPNTPGSFSYGPGLVSGTVAAWVRTTVSDQPAWLLGADNAADERAFRFGYDGAQLAWHANGDEADESFGLVDSTADMSWANGLWHHVAVAWDGFVGSATIYVDGDEVDSINETTMLTSDSNTAGWEFPLALGARDNGGALEGFFGGLVDDVRVYANALTSNQINDIINEVPQSDADFNGDDLVNGADFLAWQRGFGTGVLPEDGDANGDGAVDEIDLAAWQQQFGEDRTGSSLASVPEPGAVALTVVALAALAAAGRTEP